MSEMQIFLQVEGIREIRVLGLPPHATVRDLLKAATDLGLVTAGAETAEALAVFTEDDEEPLAPDAMLEAAGLRQGASIHVSRCKKVRVTVHFNGQERSESFGPGVPIHRVKQWATGKKGFNLSDLDAADHALQITGTHDRPDDDVHIGTLVQGSACAVEFDLVPKKRVEG